MSLRRSLPLLFTLAACDPPLDLEETIASEAFSLAGALVPTYGSNGCVLIDADVSAAGYGTAVARQADGKLVVVGEAWNGERHVGVIGRLNPDGSRDPSFPLARVDLGT